MSKFKAGDKIAVYSHLGGREVKFVRKVLSDGSLEIDPLRCAHPKQCRKIIPKKKKSHG